MTTEPTLEVVDLVKHFPVRGVGAHGVVHAVDGVSFSIGPGELLGLVGESGSGKSTVANCVIRLLDPTSGTITLKGRDITHLSRRALRPLRREMHMVFQDPYSSLDPRMTCGQIVGEPLEVQGLMRGGELQRRVEWLFDRVGLRVGAALPLPARAVRRATPARRARAGALGLAAAAGRRRARVGARRLGAGVDPQPAQRPAGGSRLLLPVHHARPRHRRVPVRPCRGDVPRQDRRARADAGAVHDADASLHAGAALGRGRSPIRRSSAAARGSCSRETSRARSSRPRAAASGRDARSSSGRPRRHTSSSLRSSRSARATWWPATSPLSRASGPP